MLSDPKIVLDRPPRWVKLLLGRPLSRSVWTVLAALRYRPDIVMGYHVFPGALSALVTARLTGACAIYQMTSGIVEIVGGGVVHPRDPRLGRSFIVRMLRSLVTELCSRFDVIIARGTRGHQFVLDNTSARNVEIIAGSVDPCLFRDAGLPRVYDLVFVGRLDAVKQPDHYIRVVAGLAKRFPALRAAVVGDGPLMLSLERLAGELGVRKNLEFRGHIENVEQVVGQAKVFVLTSCSEGLSIAMTEAMAAGAVPVVYDVGNLSDLVRDDVTGWLVAPGDTANLIERAAGLLEDQALWQRMSRAAQARAMENNSLRNVTERWERCFLALVARRSAEESELAPVTTASPDSGMRNWLAHQGLRLWQSRVPASIKSVCARPLAWVGWKRAYGRRFVANLQFAIRAEGWTADASRAYQLKQVLGICRLACERTAFYRRVFAEAGFNPQDLRSLDDLARVPTIDRETVCRHLEEMCTVSPRSAGVDRIATGSTGGVPLYFYIGINRSAVEYAYLVASWQRASYTPDMQLAELRGRIVRPDRTGLRHEHDPLLRRHYYSTFHMNDDNMRRYLEHMATIGPCYLLVYPSSIAALARFIRRSGRAVPANIRGILAGSEMVYPEQRTLVQEVFGARLFSWYGHTEKIVLAAGCEHSTDYHVWPTYGCFELLDEQGKPVTTPGQRGEIVGTGFINTVVPFIRYRTGDYATYVGDRCEACGREHTIIRDIRGHRTQEMLIAADRSEISWTALNMHDDTFANVRQFQFYQDTPGRAVLRIVPATGFSDEDRQRIQRNMGLRLDGRVTFTLDLVGAIPLSPRGKTIYVDQRIKVRDGHDHAEGAP